MIRLTSPIPWLLLLALSACAGRAHHPCQDGGEPARETPFKGNRRCTQKRGPNGKYVNNGIYQEWHPNGKVALEGNYKMGKKDGWWTEYSPDGRTLSKRFFEDGIEVTR